MIIDTEMFINGSFRNARVVSKDLNDIPELQRDALRQYGEFIFQVSLVLISLEDVEVKEGSLIAALEGKGLRWDNRSPFCVEGGNESLEGLPPEYSFNGYLENSRLQKELAYLKIDTKSGVIGFQPMVNYGENTWEIYTRMYGYSAQVLDAVVRVLE